MPARTTVNPISASEYAFSNPDDFLASPKKRVIFVLDGSVYQFVLNPQQFDYEIPARVNVIQTKGGAFVDDFGLGIGSILIRGQTKVFDRDTQKIIAVQTFKELEEKIYYAFFADQTPGLPPKHELLFLNLTDYLYFKVIPQKFSLSRDARRPFIYNYTISLIIQENLANPRANPERDFLNQALNRFYGAYQGGNPLNGYRA